MTNNKNTNNGWLQNRDRISCLFWNFVFTNKNENTTFALPWSDPNQMMQLIRLRIWFQKQLGHFHNISHVSFFLTLIDRFYGFAFLDQGGRGLAESLLLTTNYSSLKREMILETKSPLRIHYAMHVNVMTLLLMFCTSWSPATENSNIFPNRSFSRLCLC